MLWKTTVYLDRELFVRIVKAAVSDNVPRSVLCHRLMAVGMQSINELGWLRFSMGQGAQLIERVETMGRDKRLDVDLNPDLLSAVGCFGFKKSPGACLLLLEGLRVETAVAAQASTFERRMAA